MPVTVEEQEPPAWKLMLLTIGCSTTSWPPAQQLDRRASVHLQVLREGDVRLLHDLSDINFAGF